MHALKKPIPFGKYYLLERINVGGMAEVFKAKTFGVEGFERLLAVKRILPNIAEDEEFITMFIDEAKIAVQLQHANIAQIFDLGKVDESFFIALEYVNGRDLRSIFDRMRNKAESLPIAMASYVIMQVCEGLDYAHNKRDAQGRELHLVHRDISPQNVLIGYEGECKLIDFGIAKAAGKASKTQAGILKGKFGYMSPEQVRGLPIDRRSDIFAVGIVLYELLTGERLFIGESDFSTLEKVRNVEIHPPSSYNKKIPQELERVVLKALARDPDDRYANAIDLHDDLQSFLYSVGEFFSRKDLAAWMKKTFAMEIEEDNAKLEEFRQIAAPVAASNAEVSRRAAVAGAPAGRPGATGAKPAPKPPKAAGPGAAGQRRIGSPVDGLGRRRAGHADLRQGRGQTGRRRGPVLRGRRPHGGQRAGARHSRAGAAARAADAQADHAGERGHQVDAAAGGAAAAGAAGGTPADAGGRSPGRHAGAPDPARARARHASASAAGRAAARARWDPAFGAEHAGGQRARRRRRSASRRRWRPRHSASGSTSQSRRRSVRGASTWRRRGARPAVASTG